MKTCSKCKQTKAFTEFHKQSKKTDGLRSHCKVCRKEYYQNNWEKINAKVSKWQKNNREKKNANSRRWRKNNREKYRASQRKSIQRPEYKKKVNARAKERYRTDPVYRIKRILSSRLRSALNGNIKSASTMKLVGCSVQHVKDHLEKQFQPGMTWENHGKWHVDHMLACDTFDLEDPEQQRRCFHWTNLQPLWGPENISKSADSWYTGEWDPIKGWRLERL